jgi:simple sugar transport system ATP-binding protein
MREGGRVNDMSFTPGAPPLLEVRHLSKNFGAVQALRDLSMTLHGGEVVALAGDNGAGKTTLIKAISGVYPPTSGDILLDGRSVRFASPQEARDQGIETIYQDLALADNLSIGANIFLGREPMRKALGFLPVLDRRQMAEAARDTMALLDFHVSRLDAPVSNFSGGQRQAVAIGRAVYWNARVLIMDEPTAALGVPEQRKVISLIHQLKAQGRGVIFISHNLQDIFAVSDRIIVLRRGIQAGEKQISATSHEEVVRLMVGG